MDFSEELDYLDPRSPNYLASKTKIRQYLFGRQDNILLRLDKQICQKFFKNSKTPFRFLKGGDTLSDVESSVLTLRTAIDLAFFCREYPDQDFQDAFRLACSFTVDDIFDRRDEWKSLCKRYRNESFSLSKQCVLTLFRSLYVVQNKQTTVPFFNDYIENFRRYEPAEDTYEVSPHLMVAIRKLAEFISLQITEDVPILVPPTRNKMSSTGRKKVYDWYELNQALEQYTVVDTDAKRALLLCFDAIELIYDEVDCSSYRERLNKIPSSDDTLNLVEFLPRANAVAQNKGKVSRMVFAGNDIFDLALDPGMRVQKKMKAHLPSCMSSTKAGNESNYTFVYRKAKKWREGRKFKIDKHNIVTIKSDMEGADSSNATERINGYYMFDAWRTVYDCLTDQAKQYLHLNDEYLWKCREILCSVPFYYHNDGDDETCYTNGTAQGLPQSWDLLDWTTMLTILESYAQYFCEKYPNSQWDELSLRALNASANMGDDGLYASFISSYFKRNLKRVSLPGVVNMEKTESEDEVGYAPFASAYVKTGYVAPKILSNFRIVSMIRKLSNPFEFEQTQEDKFDRFQMKLVKDVLDMFRNVYNRTNRVMIDDDPLLIKDYARFSYAEKLVRFKRLRDLVFQQSTIGTIREGTNVAPCLKLAPSYRCRTVNIENMFISSDRMYVLLSENQLMSCYDNLEPVVAMMDQDLAEARELHFSEGIPWSEIYLDEEDKLFHALLAQQGVPERLSAFSFEAASVLKQYNLAFQGYFRDDMIISCNIHEEVKL